MNFSTKLLQFLFDAVIWVFVPLVVVIILFFTRRFISKADDRRQKSSMQAGFWAGVILFLMVMIYQVGIFLAEGFPKKEIFQGFDIWLSIGTGLVAFVVFSGGKWFASHKLSGIAVLLVTFLSFYTLLHYIFIRTYNNLILSLLLGITFGFLVFFATSPGTVRKTLSLSEGGRHGNH